MLQRKHLIGGQWVEGPSTFQNDPVDGPAESFADGDPALVDRAFVAAEAAAVSFGATSGAERAVFLRRIATEIEARGDAISAMASAESALPRARTEGERGRTVGQLRLFADFVEAGEHLEARHDEALPDRAPLPRPDLRMVHRPVGPVAVFGASNFPLAFSTAGGDTASALAAGCPVVVKGHPAHPGTSDLVAQAIDAARTACDLDPGVFGLVHGTSHEVGAAFVEHPLATAVGFTGSLRAGRALFDACAARPVPIPFYGELGSINPVFVLPEAGRARPAEIGAAWAASLTMGVGQFCTNPGILVVAQGDEAEELIAAAAQALAGVGAQTMLTGGIAAAFADGVERLDGTAVTRSRFAGTCEGRQAEPQLRTVAGTDFLANAALAEEVFGPLGIVVTVDDVDQMVAVAAGLEGQLTCTLQLDPGDAGVARRLLPVLERKAGRVLANGYPTGVEVAHAMVHGGPYPASTNFGATSVGTLAIRRFLRPVCFQNLPEELLDAVPGLA